jgi:hypothetical protein
VFQPLHSGQRPSHFVACAPHSVQEKIVTADFFAMEGL